jgi:VanZ like family
MNPEFQSAPETPADKYRWSLRILILAILGICLLTLYPFRIDPHSHPGNGSPFLLVGWAKAAGPRDAFLNVLLFVPYGFGLAGLLRRRGFSRIAAAAIAFAAGAMLSYGVELAQYFIPGRDSGWEDILTNSTGSLVGCFLFFLFGVPLLRILQRCEAAIERFATGRRVAAVLLCYFAVWCGFAARLERMAGLRDWDPESFLTVGGFAHPWSTQAWKGTISTLELWDQALPGNLAARITASADSGIPNSNSIASYRFTGAAPFQDLRRQSPPLNLELVNRGMANPAAGKWDGNSWLGTAVPVSQFVENVQKTGHFSIHLKFTPAETDDMDASLVNIGRAGETPNLEIRQVSEALAFWFRTPLSSRPFKLEWSMSQECEANRPRSVLFSYDGTKLWAYVDGKLDYEGYRLGPATALAQIVRPNGNVAELQGYRYTYYGLVFFPAGCLLGFAYRKISGIGNLLALIVLGIIAPSIALEISLVWSGTQPVSVGDLCFAAFMAVVGIFWINVEGGVSKKPPQIATQ